MSWALLLALALTVDDPRIGLVELQLQGQNADALQETQDILRREPELGQRLGLDFLQAHLLSELGRGDEARQSFSQAFSSAPSLEPYTRFKLAEEVDRGGHPEVAAGVVATLLTRNPPRPLVAPAVRLLRRTLARGGDCRVLQGLSAQHLPTPERRQLDLAKGICSLRLGDEVASQKIFRDLLTEDSTDEVAREAVEWVAQRPAATRDVETMLVVGMTLHQQREFSRSVNYLQMALLSTAPTSRKLPQHKEYEARYAMTRGRYWLGRYTEAATGFEELSRLTHIPDEQAQALFQRGRSLELLGRWSDAANSFRLAFNAAPNGRWADAALFGALRLEWRAGNEPSALQLYSLLLTKHGWRDMASRAALFLASSDLVQGRANRAETWLDVAAGGRETALEAHYWRGRLRELEGDLDGAVDNYLATLREAPDHPLARSARNRLETDPLAATVRRKALQLTRSNRTTDLRSAWLLLGDRTPAGAAAGKALVQALHRERGAAVYLDASLVPVDEWPLWQASLDQPEEQLLALGLWRDGAPAIREHFPLSEPSLALTGSYLLARGGAYNQSLRLASILDQSVPDDLPFEMLPELFQQLLYPGAYEDTIRSYSQNVGIDAALLQAIIREESHYNPEAFSGAAARGLTQFVMPTARDLAFKMGYGPLSSEDLYSPQLSIALGAAYLRQLLDEFGGARHVAIAAYNAGEPVARLWRSYCFSPEPEEYFTKVGYKETRNYLRKVSSSFYRYQQIYEGRLDVPGERPAPRTFIPITDTKVSWRGARTPPK
ncbi:MAG: transglycosylase SLT domain-containing protein [Acidobacteria bacterium]|nr:transglycosylase SLT domain-containing protein [Acidobacteriota bacterium]